MSLPSSVKKAPSAFVAALIAKANRPHAVIPFPLLDDAGEPVAHVYIRGLSQEEEDVAFANARSYTLRLTAEEGAGETRWKPDELEHNARASEILSIACRNADDPSKPFFEHGVVDTRQFETDVLGQLMNAYNELKELYYPRLREMSKEDFDEFVDVIAAGAEQLPFWRLSRATLEAFCRSAVTSLVDARATITTLMDSSTSDS